MRLRRRLLPALATLAAGALAVPLASCGADDLNPEAVAEAAEATAAADSMRFRMVMTAEGEAVEADGYAATDPLRMRMTMELPPLGEVETVLDERAMYLRVPPEFAEAFGAGDAEWVKVDLEDLTGMGLGGATSGALGSPDPVQQLETLKAMGDIEEVGTEEIDGVETTRYRGEIDLREAVGFAAPDQQDALERSIDAFAKLNDGETVVPTEVWVDEDSLVRRMTQRYGETLGAITIDFSDYGADEDVEVPSGDDVTDITDQVGAVAPGP